MNRREELLAWVGQQHQGQLVRKTMLPYMHHLKAVAETADIVPLGYETGLCHDLLEKTAATKESLLKALLKFGYSKDEASVIVSGVIELTNVFTKKACPEWRKPARKKKEAERLATSSPVAQTVKYADLRYNITWMRAYDHKHLEKYLRKKRHLLQTIDKGDQELYRTLLIYIDSISL
jgi:hypothetical protein